MRSMIRLYLVPVDQDNAHSMNILLADRFFANSNHLEAGLWMVIGAGFFVRVATKSAFRGPCAIAAITFIAFGFSDVVEARTGAWWRPWWLLVWKALCVLVFLALLFQYAKWRKAASRR